MLDDPDVIFQIAVAAAAMIALCALQPRWDTGGGALLIFSLGIVAAPIWVTLAAIAAAGCIAWLFACWSYCLVRFVYNAAR